MINGIAYFDNAATTFPKPERVYEFMDRFYRDCGVNVGRGQHRLSAKAASLVDETRELVLSLFHAPNKKAIFTPTATEALNLILRGISLSDGDTVYISPFEHNAVTRVLHKLSEEKEISIIQLKVDRSSLTYKIDEIKKQFAEKKPNCVIISHSSNVCGAVAPISEVFTEAKKYNALTVVDMCQTAGLIDTDLSGEIFDFTVFEGHKTLYGPMGVGGMIVKPSIELEPLIYGGTGVDSANQDMPKEIPMRYEAGSMNIHAVAGLNAAIKWINNSGMDTIFKQEQSAKDKLVKMLSEYDNIQIIHAAGGVGVVSCVFDGYSSDSIGIVLSEQNVAIRTGLHCAPNAHRFLGTFPSGTVRFSVGYFTNDEDFNALRQALDYIQLNG